MAGDRFGNLYLNDDLNGVWVEEFTVYEQFLFSVCLYQCCYCFCWSSEKARLFLTAMVGESWAGGGELLNSSVLNSCFQRPESGLVLVETSEY